MPSLRMQNSTIEIRFGPSVDTPVPNRARRSHFWEIESLGIVAGVAGVATLVCSSWSLEMSVWERCRLDAVATYFVPIDHYYKA